MDVVSKKPWPTPKDCFESSSGGLPTADDEAEVKRFLPLSEAR